MHAYIFLSHCNDILDGKNLSYALLNLAVAKPVPKQALYSDTYPMYLG